MMKSALKYRGIVSVVIGLALFGVSSALAADAEHHILRANAGYFTTTGDETLNLSDIKYESTSGFSVGYEYKFTPLIGVPLDYGRFGSHVKLENAGKATGDFDAATLGLMFHLVHARVVDFYVGPEAAYIMYGSSDFKIPGVGKVKVDVDNETTWGAKAGIDIKPFTWFGIGVSVEYLDASADFKLKDAASGNGSLDPKPVITRAGVSFRF